MQKALTPSVFYGLVAMTGWGTINLLVASLTKKIGSFKTAFLIQVFAFFPTLLLFPFFQAELSLGKNFFLLSLLGGIGALTYVCLTKGYSEGAVSIVAPMTSFWAVITAVLSFLFLREKVVPLKILGIITAFIGVALVSADFEQMIRERKMKLLTGARWGLLTALGWGINFFLLAFFSRRLGWYSANLGLRFWSVIAFLGLSKLKKERFNHLLRNIPQPVWAAIILDVLTFATYNIGLVKGETSTVSVIGSASPLVSVLLARIFLKETVSLIQRLGIILCLLGIASLSLV